MWFGRRRGEELADARAEARRWYERLGGQIMNLSAGGGPAVKQSMVDAGERYAAAGAELDRAESVAQYALAGQTAIEGLTYIRAARIALGLDPGPALPPLAGQRAAGQIREPRSVEVEGRQVKAAPGPAGETPYYHPGGMVSGRPVPQGWYSEPWWRTALVAGAWSIGSIMVFDALFGQGFGYSDGGYDDGFRDGAQYADDHGDDGPGGADGGDQGGTGYDTAGTDTTGYDAGAFDGGGFDGGGFDGGGFDGGGF